MASISLVVQVTITKGTRTVTLASFNVPLIMGPSNRIGGDAFRSYTDPAAMLTDGFLLSDPEYIHAAMLMAQPIKPNQFIISKFTAAVAQVDTFQVNTLTNGHAYAFTLNSIVITFTAGGGDTQQSILAALLTAIGVAFPANPPVTGAVVGVGAGATLTLTSTEAGQGVSYTAIDAQLTHALTVVNHSIVQDLQTLQGVITPLNQFYGVLITSKADGDIEQMAAYIETQLLIYLSSTLSAGVLTNSVTDIASELMGFAYNRTGLIWSAQANTNPPDAAWMGYMLPTTPGIGNWAEKTLVGVTADNLTQTQINNALGKNCNVYVPMGGAGTVLFGTVVSGEYIDVTIFLDWLAATIQTNVFAVQTDPNNLKIPFTNQGIGQIKNPIRAAMQQGQDNQGLAPGWNVFAPDVSSVTSADKKARILRGVGFTGTLAGAINKIIISGNVST